MRSTDTLKLVTTLSGLRYSLQDKPLRGGDIVAMCFSGGWVVGRFEWTADPADRPRFHCSIELEGGGVEALDITIPERALLQRREPGAVL